MMMDSDCKPVRGWFTDEVYCTAHNFYCRKFKEILQEEELTLSQVSDILEPPLAF
jgi:hypothetical protein